MTATPSDITIYRADWVLPVSAPVIADGALAVAGERIVGLGAATDLIAAHPGASLVDAGRSIIMPGFVNCHSHIEYTSFRGILDDLAFGDWITRLVDVKAALTPEEYLVSARLGAVEALASGITTIADSSYQGVALQALGETGLRGRVYLEILSIDDTGVDETMVEIERRLAEAEAAAPPQLDVGLMPHSPYAASSRLYQAVSALARERGLSVMSHVAQSKDELTYVRSGSGKLAHDYRERMGWERMLVQPFGVSPIKYLQQWGAFDADFLAAHCVLVTHDDIRILKEDQVAVAHCPKSNAKLGCGVAPLADLLREGVRVGLGTDSPASSNIMDMFGEMRTMLFLQRAVERDVSVLDAQACVRIATLGGAEALGMENEVGSLEPGKYADFIAVDVSMSHFAPIDDPYSALVYGANQDDVLLTVIGGRPLYREDEFADVDAEGIRREAYGVREQLGARVRAGNAEADSGEQEWQRASDVQPGGEIG